MTGPPLVNGGGSSRSANGDASSSFLTQGAASSEPPLRNDESAADPSSGAAATAVATTTATTTATRPPIASASERPPPPPALWPSSHQQVKSSSRLTRAQSLTEPSSNAASSSLSGPNHPPQHLRVASTNDPPPPPAQQQLPFNGDDGPRPGSSLADPTQPRGRDAATMTESERELLQGETSGGIGGDAEAVERGGEHHVLQRKGRFTLLQPALSPPSISAAAAPATATPANPSGDAASGAAGDDADAAAAEGFVTQAPHPSPSGGPGASLPPLPPPAAATAATVPSEPPAARGTKKKGRFTLMHETEAAPAVTIVVDRAPSRAPSIHEPDPERGVSMASTAMSSLSASVMPAAELAPLTTTTAPAVVTTIPAPSGAAASASSAPTVKKMGRFVVSSVDPHAGDAGTAPGPPHSVNIPVGIHHPASAVPEPVMAEGPAHAVAVGAPSSGSPAIPREVVAVLEHGGSAGGTAPVASTGPPAALQGTPHPQHGPSPPQHPPALPTQPILHALVPAPVPLPSQPVPNGSMGAAEPLSHISGACAAPPTTTTTHAEIGSTPPIRPSLSSSNLAGADVAVTGQQESHLPHGSASTAQSVTVATLHVPAPLPAARESSSVPVQPLAHDALHVPPISRSVEAPTAAAPAPPLASTPGGKGGGGKARNAASGYTGRQGVGKMFHYLDQLRLEATDAEHTIKNLMTDVRLLKEKNKELEATARDTERKLIEERKLREAAEHKLKQAKKKVRDLTQATSQPREDHTKSASTSYDSLGIAASLSGEYRDDRMTIEPPIESVANSAAPLSPPFTRRPELAYTPTRDHNPALGDAGCPPHSSSPAPTAAFVAKGNLNAQPPVEPGRQSAGNSPRTSQQARLLLSNSGKLPPLPNTSAPQVVMSNGGSARTPNDRPPLGSSNPARDIQFQSQNGTAPPNRSLAMEFDPMRPANRDRLPSGDSISDLPEITSEPVAHAALPNPVHPVSPTQRLASKTYHGIRDLHQQFHLQQPALDCASAAPTLHPSSSFSEFRHMVLVPQNPDAAHGGSPIVFALPSSFAPNGNQQWIPVAVQDPTTFVAQQPPPGPGPAPDPFDEIVRRTSNPG